MGRARKLEKSCGVRCGEVRGSTKERSKELRLSIDAEPANAAWDAFVGSTPGGHHTQTSMWGRVKSLSGWGSLRLLAHQDADLVGGVQLLTREFGSLGRVAFAPRGPILADRDPGLEERLISAIFELGREEKIRYLKVQPPTERDDLVAALRKGGWSPSTLEAAPVATVRVDLAQSTDELLARMHRSHRQHLRAAERKGLRARVGGERDLASFFGLLEATRRRQGDKSFVLYPQRHYEAMWRIFAAEDQARLLMIEHGDRLLSAVLLLSCGEYVTAKMAGWSGARGAYPNELMHWSAMRWGKERGHRWYDFDGLGSPGVARFKLRLGGEAVRFPGALDISPHPVLRPLVRVAAPHLDRALPVARRMLGRRG